MTSTTHSLPGLVLKNHFHELPLDYANYGVVVANSLLKNQRDIVYRFLQALTEGIHVFKTQPEKALAVLSEVGNDAQTTRTLYERLAKAMRDYPAPDARGIQAVLDSLPNPKARVASAEDYTDSSLMEEIKKSGFIERLYGKNQ